MKKFFIIFIVAAVIAVISTALLVNTKSVNKKSCYVQELQFKKGSVLFAATNITNNLWYGDEVEVSNINVANQDANNINWSATINGDNMNYTMNIQGSNIAVKQSLNKEPIATWQISFHPASRSDYTIIELCGMFKVSSLLEKALYLVGIESVINASDKINALEATLSNKD